MGGKCPVGSVIIFGTCLNHHEEIHFGQAARSRVLKELHNHFSLSQDFSALFTYLEPNTTNKTIDLV